MFSKYAKEFNMFSISHLIPVLFIIIAVILLIIFKYFLKRQKVKLFLRIFISILCVLSFTIYFSWLAFYGYLSRRTLPLELCDITALLVIFTLIFNNQYLFEFLYFAGIGASIQALATPALYYDFPHFIYFYFFFNHGIVVWTAFFMIFIEKKTITFFSVIRALIFFNIISFIVLLINIILKTNYMFLMEKPSTSSLFDYLGPWPIYLLSSEFCAIIFFLFLYTPFLIHKKIKNKKNKIY